MGNWKDISDGRVLQKTWGRIRVCPCGPSDLQSGSGGCIPFAGDGGDFKKTQDLPQVFQKSL